MNKIKECFNFFQTKSALLCIAKCILPLECWNVKRRMMDWTFIAILRQKLFRDHFSSIPFDPHIFWFCVNLGGDLLLHNLTNYLIINTLVN